MRLRGKKGIRGPLDSLSRIVVLNPQQYRGKWREFFGNDRPIHVELGMGKGGFISEMSRRHKDINFIGVDMYDELIRRALEKAREAHKEEGQSGDPSNLALVLMNIERIEDMFAENELERIYLNFSDPWPKKRHAKRRLTHPRFLKKYLGLLNSSGEIHLKTDSPLFFEFSLNAFACFGLQLHNISLDLHRDGNETGLVMTEYEKKFVEQGKNIYRCEVIVGEEALARIREKNQKQWNL